MDSISAFAANGYNQTKPLIAGPTSAPAQAMDPATEFLHILNAHESTARAAMTGAADPHKLVEALSASQLAVETVTAVRDRVVEAYQEILRMQI